MKKIDLEELKVIQMDVLEAIHTFCIDNDIRYSLACGTLLGAVRHKGYIPWDDDIDIYLLREDYNKLMRLFPQQYNGWCRIVSLDRDDNWDRCYAKAYDDRTVFVENAVYNKTIGVGIDVYPIDNVPDSEKGWRIYNKIRRQFQKLSWFKWMKVLEGRSFYKNMVVYIVKGMLFCISSRRMAMLLNRIAQLFNKEKRIYVFETCQGMYGKNRFKKDCFNDIKEIPFEDRKFMAFSNYDEYLSNHFGNYMALPPKEKQVLHHDYQAYWMDK